MKSHNVPISLDSHARIGLSTRPIYSSVAQKLKSQLPNPIRIGPAAVTGPIRMLHDVLVNTSARYSVRTQLLTRVKKVSAECTA